MSVFKRLSESWNSPLSFRNWTWMAGPVKQHQNLLTTKKRTKRTCNTSSYKHIVPKTYNGHGFLMYDCSIWSIDQNRIPSLSFFKGSKRVAKSLIHAKFHTYRLKIIEEEEKRFEMDCDVWWCIRGRKLSQKNNLG